jgi:hypothetical protein
MINAAHSNLYRGFFSPLMLSAYEELFASHSALAPFNWSSVSTFDTRITHYNWLDPSVLKSHLDGIDINASIKCSYH